MKAISKAKIKLFKSLQLKKYRGRTGLAILPGLKLTLEALESSWKIESILVLEGQDTPFDLSSGLEEKLFSINEADLRQITGQQNPEGFATIAEIPDALRNQHSIPSQPPSGQALVLDDVRDPGNLGTLLRICDWFGIPNLICSSGSADVLNPKVLRASMGAIFRVNVWVVVDLQEILKSAGDRVWAADMDGTPLSSVKFAEDAWLLLGNESRGVSPETRALSNVQKVTIPGRGGAESLNVAVAAGILAHAMSLK